MDVSVVQEPLAFILPKRETVFCLDEKELVPELPAPAPALPAEEPRLEPATPASPEAGQEEEPGSAEPLPPDAPGAGP